LNNEENIGLTYKDFIRGIVLLAAAILK